MVKSKLVLIISLWMISNSVLCSINESRMMAAMRSIGHQTLMDSGDSTSRVLPVSKENNTYKISFESEFSLLPDNLVVNSIKALEQADLSNHFLVELVACSGHEVLYSFEFRHQSDSNSLPCRAREIPKGCYAIHVIILDSDKFKESQVLTNTPPANKENNASAYWFFIILLPIALSVALFWKKTPQKRSSPHIISIGAFHFDKRNMTLAKNDEIMDLTGKEADLLALLYSHANTTVERQVLLEKVWGDEGDYIGRTLDVFISKLRKKLDGDEQVKIVNIRGVGYKMILN